jgi:hypothetical protein
MAGSTPRGADSESNLTGLNVSEIRRTTLFGKLNTLAYKALESGAVVCRTRGNPYLELVHWVHQIFSVNDSDLRRIAQHFAINPASLAADVTRALEGLPKGSTAIADLSPDVDEATERGWVYSTLMFGSSNIRTGALVIGILKTPSLRPKLLAISDQFAFINVDVLTDQFPAICAGSPEDSLSAQDGSTLLSGAAKAQRDIFISYRRQDSAHATGRIFDRLATAFGGSRVFKDVNSIPAGVKDFAVELQQQMRSARVMLAVVGDSWLTIQNSATGKRRLDEKDDYVRIELKWGLDQESVPVIPVLLDHAEMPVASSLPTALRAFARCQAIRVRADPEFNRDVESLILEIKRSLGNGAMQS